MLSRDQLVTWLRTTYGWRHIDHRVTDIGYAYSVNTIADRYLFFAAHELRKDQRGEGPLIVHKGTGKVWVFGDDPVLQPIYRAASEEEFFAAMRGVAHEWFGGGEPEPVAIIPLDSAYSVRYPLSRERLLEWMRDQGWQRVDGRITGDLGFAFVIDTSPDTPISDDIFPGNLGPTFVLKRNGALYHTVAPAPNYHWPIESALTAQTEEELLAVIGKHPPDGIISEHYLDV